MCARAGVRGCAMNEMCRLMMELLSDEEQAVFQEHKQFLVNYLSEHGELALLALEFTHIEMSNEVMQCLAKKS